jgi:uncharacterized membrane protein (UPF0127 family)
VPKRSSVAVRSASTGAIVAARVEIADGWWSRLVGLMLRRAIAHDAGLLIEPCKSIHMMFMRFAIDAVFVGRAVGAGAAAGGGTRPVVAVYRNLAAWTGLVPFVRGAHGVLELPIGVVEASGTEVGDLIEIG